MFSTWAFFVGRLVQNLCSKLHFALTTFLPPTVQIWSAILILRVIYAAKFDALSRTYNQLYTLNDFHSVLRFITSSSTATPSRTTPTSMAQPSSSHHRERERERERSHHHHRTISSTTLLLVLSLILAVLAVMLSLPSTQGATGNPENASSGVWNYLSPKRSQNLVAREHAVAQREAEVARREADLLAGMPGGVTPLSCPPVPAPSSIPAPPQVYVETPVQTIIKEVVKEVESLAPPSWWRDAPIRMEELLDREARVSDREKDVGRREETIGRRETDVSRRESWIMEQLM